MIPAGISPAQIAFAVMVYNDDADKRLEGLIQLSCVFS